MNNIFEARGAIKLRRFSRPGVYPTVPANWPNRKVRRAVRTRTDSRLPAVWATFLALNKDFRKAIVESKLIAGKGV